ncbi:hypothetical protein RUM43_002757 [Polyplax serrata]|uniref:Uncharacterized protein n=1 Tax=Polyplax serrata TaxID=468196 RepID=A0AAN8S2T0_POLSC
MLRYSDALRLQESPIYAFQNPRGSNLRARAGARARARAGGLIEKLPLQVTTGNFSLVFIEQDNKT